MAATRGIWVKPKHREEINYNRLRDYGIWLGYKPKSELSIRSSSSYQLKLFATAVTIISKLKMDVYFPKHQESHLAKHYHFFFLFSPYTKESIVTGNLS